MRVAFVQIDVVGMYVNDRDISVGIAVYGIHFHYITNMNDPYSTYYILTLNLYVLNHTAVVGIDNDDDVVGDKQAAIGR